MYRYQDGASAAAKLGLAAALEFRISGNLTRVQACFGGPAAADDTQ